MTNDAIQAANRLPKMQDLLKPDIFFPKIIGDGKADDAPGLYAALHGLPVVVEGKTYHIKDDIRIVGLNLNLQKQPVMLSPDREYIELYEMFIGKMRHTLLMHCNFIFAKKGPFRSRLLSEMS